MGFFSWDCKGCGHPMLSPYALDDKNGWMNDVVVIEKDGSILRGEYDGYGRVNACSINVVSGVEPACYHQHCWEKAGSPLEHDGSSKSSFDQGYFFDEGVHNVDPPQ